MLRISSGNWRGRLIQAPPGDKTRPSSARLRQALFNSLQTRLEGARVLDLFAGSGALAFEALSRGAEFAVCVENARGALVVLKKNIETLKAERQCRVVADDVGHSSGVLEKWAPFDLVFADPPYSADWEMRLIEKFSWPKLLQEEGLLVIEWSQVKSVVSELPEVHELGSGLRLIRVREKVYGDSILTTYRMTRDEVTPLESDQASDQEDES